MAKKLYLNLHLPGKWIITEEHKFGMGIRGMESIKLIKKVINYNGETEIFCLTFNFGRGKKTALLNFFTSDYEEIVHIGEFLSEFLSRWIEEEIPFNGIPIETFLDNDVYILYLVTEEGNQLILDRQRGKYWTK